MEQFTRDEEWLLKEKHAGIVTTDFLADRARLAGGEPLAYVIGHLPFLNSTIWLDSHPLIPRSETEYWLSECHAMMRTRATTELRILDLCAGSGAIGVATLVAFQNCTVDFVEIDRAHRPTIEKNLDINHVEKARYRIFAGDLFSPLGSTDRYDFILSNPPYIDQALGRTDQSVIQNEPALALFSEKAGLAHIERIISESPQYLLSKGELWLEHEPEQSQAIQDLGATHFTVCTYRDQYNVERFSRLVLQ